MGLMTTLRNRSGLLIGAIGFAIVAFLVGDAITTGTPFWRDYQNEIGKIGDKEISFQEFDAKLAESIESYKMNSKQSSIDDNVHGYLVDQTWNNMVSENILLDQYGKLGITVSGEELADLVFGNNPHPQIRQAFTSKTTGVFNPNDVKTFLRTMDERDPSGETRKQWLTFEKDLQKERIRQKYFSLIKNGLYIPTAHAKMDYQGKNQMATIKYIAQEYFAIPDSAVKVSESDLSDYYKENKYKFKQKEAQRSFEYVVYDVIPSSVDSDEVKKWINEQVEVFKNTKDDSVYISLNSDEKYTGAYMKKGQLPPMLDSIMFSASAGTVYGPYLEGNSYKLAKLIEVRSLPDSVKARHILIKPKNGNIEAAKAKADSLKKLIKAGASFADLAKANSEDGSAAKGGDLGYFGNAQMVKPFSDACFYGKTGDMPVVVSDFGVHLIEIMDQKNFAKAVKVGIINRSIDPSTPTVQAVYAKANTMLGSLKDGKEFKDKATKAGLTVRVAENLKENDKYLAGMEKPRELIRWAYKAEIDDISPLFEMGNKFVFAHLTQVKDKGYVPLEYVKTEVEVAVKKEKKAAMLIEKLEKAAQGASTIEDIAKKAGSPLVQTASNVLFAQPIIPGVAREPEVIGTVFGLGKGKISKPVKGDRGVYIVYVESITDAPPAADYNMNKLQMINPLKQRADMEMLEALKEKANVVDNRVKFY